MLKVFEEITIDTEIPVGAVLRRVGENKDQQGRYVSHTDDKTGWLLAEVIDPTAGSFLAEGGIIKKEEQDKIYICKETFGNSDQNEKAMEILQNWSLFQKNTNLQSEILQFVSASFLPAQIMDWKKKDNLRLVFVPIQERFKIGKHREKINIDKVRMERFLEQISELSDGKHLTYVAFIPRDTTHKPMFFSIGTKPHLETKKNLIEGDLAFHPNHGGHIKCLVDGEGNSVLAVDAGSNDLGAGQQTSLGTAEMIADSLKDQYPDFQYKPLAGRGAFGIMQSY